MNEFKELTDSEYKVLQFIRSYNNGRDTMRIPSTDYIAQQLDKGRTTAFRIMASLRGKGFKV